MKTRILSSWCLLAVVCAFSFFTLMSSQMMSKAQQPFPEAAVINVQTRYGAKGDGITDDTAAIQKALYENAGIIYLPDGEYLVSDSLKWMGQDGKWAPFRTLQGQSREKTIIRLKDKTFTDSQKPQGVIHTASIPSQWPADSPQVGSGHNAFNNNVYDLTIDTGRGNSGAIGLDFNASNVGTVENVSIRSGDENRIGVTGLSLLRYVGPCLIKNVSIEGFDVGIDSDDWDLSQTFENITLKHQRKVGIRNTNNLLSFRKLHSVNQVSVIENNRDVGGIAAGLIVVSDGRFEGGSPTAVAIKNEAGLLARNIQASGYKAAVSHGGKDVPGLQITEYSSEIPASLFATRKHLSRNIKVRETPAYNNSRPNDWAIVRERQPNEQDDTSAIQQAIDSGKSCVFFPQGRTYEIADTIFIRGKVRRIFGSANRVRTARSHRFTDSRRLKPVFRFETGTGPFVVFERFWCDFYAQTKDGTDINQNVHAVMIENASRKNVVLKNLGLWGDNIQAYRNTPGAGSLFLEDVSSTGDSQFFVFHKQQVWARQFNPEVRSEKTIVENNGGSLWILGLKTEGKGTLVWTHNGGRTEIFGGRPLVVDPIKSDIPMFRVDNSHLVLAFAESHQNNYKVLVQETQNGIAKQALNGDTKRFPLRGGRGTSLYLSQ
jgi:hypothetical protein